MRTNNQTQNRRGIATMDTALLLPIMLVLIICLFDVARFYWMQHVVRDAAFEGVRAAILHETTQTQIETIIEDELAGGGVAVDPAITIGSRVPKEPVEVSVTIPFSFLILNHMLPEIPAPRRVAATAVMTHER